MKSYKAIKITVFGRVQGVGFRPFIFSLAKDNNIYGTVQNNMDGVIIFAEGTNTSLNIFIEKIKKQSPRLANIDNVSCEDVPVQHFSTFEIIESNRSGTSSLVIPIDASVCPDCIIEMNNPDDLRYQYPFINCTQCGPRYTIIKQLPYDRPYTTMSEFKMCDQCQSEYEDPLNRRHHAQPIACPTCGPTVSLSSIKGDLLCSGNEAINEVKQLLKAGKIVAIKGIGGYHLACNGYDERAIKTLRERKNRPNRPLAVMAGTISDVEAFTFMNEKERELLQSPEAPIVVLQKKDDHLLNCIAPGMETIGVLLPYTPLHKLLFMDSNLKLLIMTSANPSGMPMLSKDEEAYDYLSEIADFILMHNREIEHPIDDSVLQVVNDEKQFFRRARGYVPDPFFSKKNMDGIVALGPQQKNTFALGRNEQVFIGPHIGDMGSIEVTNHFLKELNHLTKWLGVKQQIIAIDKHPNYETSSLAKEMTNEKIIKVQHHHAHHVACMTDNDLDEPCFGLILDGTGYGDDGHIWGFELLYGDANNFKRYGHLSYYPLPGGEKVVKEPWRNAVSLVVSNISNSEKLLNEIFPNKAKEIETIVKMITKKINSPLAGTCGRLFDGVSALLNICEKSTYDGEAAIRLSEKIQETDWIEDYYSFEVINEEGLQQIVIRDTIQELIEDIQNQLKQSIIILKFHRTIVEMCLTLITNTLKKNPLLNKKVVLSGGSFHNRFLLTHIVRVLREKGFEVFTHKKVPCNDGGISLGQLTIAKAKLENEKGEL